MRLAGRQAGRQPCGRALTCAYCVGDVGAGHVHGGKHVVAPAGKKAGKSGGKRPVVVSKGCKLECSEKPPVAHAAAAQHTPAQRPKQQP